MKRYSDLSSFLKTKFGGRVFKVSLTAETSCPNIDGTLAHGGCTFCNDAAYSPLGIPHFARERKGKPISLQLQEGIDYLKKRHKTGQCIAYFQSFTSTYGAKKELLRKFEESLEPSEVVGLALSTRPDCIDEEWALSLGKLFRRKFGWIELGLQSSNDQTLARINRWHTRWQFSQALQILKNAGDISVCAHVVIGLPGETRKEVMETARFLATQPIDGIKIHNLHVVKGTELAEEYRRGNFEPLSLERFASLAVDFLEWIQPQILIHRLNAHAPRHLTLAPDWSVNKLAIFNAVEAELARRECWQGKALGYDFPEPPMSNNQ